jgi:hypothetical protein
MTEVLYVRIFNRFFSAFRIFALLACRVSRLVATPPRGAK